MIGLDSTQDVLGALGSFLLLITPGMDQIRRCDIFFKTWREGHIHPKLQPYWHAAVAAGESELARWRWWESLSMAMGAFLLMLSFWV